MSYRDRDDRLRGASEKYQEVMTTPGPPPMKPYYDAGVVGFVFGEMWTRPGLSRRDRRWVTLACVGAMSVAVPIQTHVYGSLNSGDITVEEMEEFLLFFATQCGWPRAQLVDQYIIEAVDRLGASAATMTRWAEPTDDATRRARGRAAYEEIMAAPAPAGDTVYEGLGYLDYLYGEIWTRPVLSRRERRIIALSCAGVLDAEAEEHAYAALRSGDLTRDELEEVVLHYAVYCGWLNGRKLDAAVRAAVQRAADDD
jgi:4-carboxymuconolactone decarboxylase